MLQREVSVEARPIRRQRGSLVEFEARVNIYEADGTILDEPDVKTIVMATPLYAMMTALRGYIERSRH